MTPHQKNTKRFTHLLTWRLADRHYDLTVSTTAAAGFARLEFENVAPNALQEQAIATIGVDVIREEFETLTETVAIA